ncbi:phosphopantetheine-binding protein [Streptomyces chromofuscus]|uniref:Acyl carrier protein n=1 Tax=Streptomyces chromofuscus TaxID=42881 RepID=A0A7M2SZH0_STRCW|nr:phosphopantetheine-binding protein [Streptomyces chromofuscus]QOV41712.1 acyl carrier protein [Streptomyces chromofuscus]GGS89075.1 acyl carrier protein [Streptomyces chromofuscus]
MTQATERTELPERLVELITHHLEVRVDRDRLTPDVTFASIGMDSLSLMELVVAAEEEFGIVLPDEALDLSPASTLGDAARAFRDAA